jgi:dTDP-N-acetylfucosamine:lipid II N-acetylfucosaminyltransferase
VVLMNHRRQQAVGNTCAALYRGATVYMRRDNPLYGFFAGLGIALLPIEALEAAPAAPLSLLSGEQKRRNRAAIEARYGRARVVAAIGALDGFRRSASAA